VLLCSGRSGVGAASIEARARVRGEGAGRKEALRSISPPPAADSNVETTVDSTDGRSAEARRIVERGTQRGVA